jgi:beta-phosphoglucomutase-like phosphatase (HAD superfamily)
LRARLEAEQGEHLGHGIHLIVAQSADGSLIVGDRHHYAATPDGFADERIDQLILDEFAAATGRSPPAVREGWIGTYAAADRTMFMDAPARAARLIDGARSVFEALHAEGIKVGSSSGYTREMMAPVLHEAAAQGYVPDHLVCSGETPAGRPTPLADRAARIAAAEKSLLAAGADVTIDTIAGLLSVLG